MIKYYEGDGRLSLVTEHNGVLYLTGRTSEGKNIKEQTQGVLNIVDETLAKYNSDKEHILRVQIFLKDVLRDFDNMNEVWEAWIVEGKRTGAGDCSGRYGIRRPIGGNGGHCRDERISRKFWGVNDMMKAHESLIGQRIIKPDAAAKVTGDAKFTADLAVHRTDLLYAKALFPPYGHAKILSIDTSEAEAVEGVEIVMTAKDLPTESSNGYGLDEHDKPVLAEEKVIYEGDAVAILAARDLKTAEEAVSLIKVEYEPLPVYDDPREVFEREAGLIHEEHPFSGDSNISYSAGIDHGNIEEVFAKADVVLDNYFETPMVDHAYLEPDVCIAEPDLVQGESPSTVRSITSRGQKALCGVLGLPQSKIRVISTIVGGAFGGKEDSTFDVSAIAGVLALKTRKPVYYEETREEVFRATGKRHAAFLHHRLASDKTGRILAIDVFNIIDKGAYQSVDAIPDRTLLYAGGPYKISASRVSAHSVYTNHPYGCAFRGLGAPQAHFAIECQMDMLAHELGMDPIELRLKKYRTWWRCNSHGSGHAGGTGSRSGRMSLESKGCTEVE